MICISLPKYSFSEIKKNLNNTDLFELRSDIYELTIKELDKILSITNNFILKINSKKSNFQELVKFSLEKNIKFIDIDINDKKAIMYYHNLNKYSTKLIISYHNYETTPEKSEIIKIIKKQFKNGDIVKFVTKTNDINDAIELLSLYNTYKNLITFGLGDIGRFTRVSAHFLGSPIDYVSLNKNKLTAPGQYDFKTFQKIIKLFNE